MNTTTLSYRELIVDNWAKLVNYLTPLLKSRHDAEDIVQDAFCKLADKAIADVDGIAKAMPTVIATTRNLALDLLKSRKYRKYISFDDLDLPCEARCIELVDALETLPNHLFDIVQLTYWGRMGSAKVAELLNDVYPDQLLTAVKVRKLLVEARELLRQVY
jgi:RNA polymerase sigma factor (sigma-70 family)